MVEDIKYYKDLAEKTRRVLEAKNKELYKANKYKALYESLQAELTRLKAVGEAVDVVCPKCNGEGQEEHTYNGGIARYQCRMCKGIGVITAKIAKVKQLKQALQQSGEGGR